MTKLTTEITIEELQYRIHAHENDLTQMWTADYFLNVQKELLAFKQSAKNSADLKTLVISEIVDFYAGFESPGEPETVDEAQIKLIERIEKVFGLTAPVLPKQPEHSRQHFESLCNQFWNWAEFDEINQDEEPRLEWNGSDYTHRVTAALWKMYQAAPAQSPIPEQPEFYTKADRFLPECLKPEEISGERRNSRIAELMGWFDRYYNGGANPKWLKSHAAELCYYILTVSPTTQPVSEPYKLPDGYLLLPQVPTQAHLNSIAMRYRHDFYLLNDAQKQNAIAVARQMYEECSGQGFYTVPAAPAQESE